MSDQGEPNFLDQAMNLVQASSGAAAEEIVGTAGGGAVAITASGDGEFRRVRIDPTAVDPADVSMLEDLVLAAINATMEKIGAAQRASIEAAMGGLMGGGLGDLLGGLAGGGAGTADGGLGEMMSGLLGGAGDPQVVDADALDEDD